MSPPPADRSVQYRSGVPYFTPVRLQPHGASITTIPAADCHLRVGRVYLTLCEQAGASITTIPAADCHLRVGRVYLTLCEQAADRIDGDETHRSKQACDT